MQKLCRLQIHLRPDLQHSSSSSPDGDSQFWVYDVDYWGAPVAARAGQSSAGGFSRVSLALFFFCI